jgi:hypothetical protein
VCNMHHVTLMSSTFSVGPRAGVEVEDPPTETTKARKRETVAGLSLPQSGRRDSNPRPPEPHTRFAERKLLLKMRLGGQKPATLRASVDTQIRRRIWVSTEVTHAPLNGIDRTDLLRMPRHNHKQAE